ncbi:MAG: TetR/AcrR family transcriptional regulator [Sphaerochaetaceae bacterium]|nr:TetR/AcrR family transcriptional regulator [Sphaerochaetaceae bacterium]
MDTKQKILDAYLNLGQSTGFMNISLSQIAESVGIRKASLFSHFKDKKEIETTAIESCRKALGEAQLNIDFKAKDRESLFVNLINSFIDVFSEFPVSALLSYAEQMRSTDSAALSISKDIDKIITSRLLVALDYCVQRSWTQTDNTDALAQILCPAVRDMISGFTDEEDLTDNILSLL